MKKFFILPIIFALLLLGAGCGKDSGTTETSPTPSDSLEEITSKAEKIQEMSCDLVVTSGEEPEYTAKMYMKGTRMRQEFELQGQKIVMLGDMATALYMYYPDKNTAIKTDLSESQDKTKNNPYEYIDESADSTTIIGHETIDNKKCVVTETKTGVGENLIIKKMWIWEKYDMPIKIVSTSGNQVTTTEYKNIEIGNQSDALFELPAGVQIIDMGALMQGNLDADALKTLEGLGQ
ncbi:MAG: hypothetical protein PHW53_01370 [Patescibacteria group bacterium]|nr:hypothetical protein [Patescibacteria group bacterium]